MMNDSAIPSGEPDPELGSEGLLFILPAFVSAMGFSCAREWTQDRLGQECGCPQCLRKIGLVLCWHPEDWNESADMQDHWRRRIVSVKVAGYASHLICPGYLGDGG